MSFENGLLINRSDEGFDFSKVKNHLGFQNFDFRPALIEIFEIQSMNNALIMSYQNLSLLTGLFSCHKMKHSLCNSISIK